VAPFFVALRWYDILLCFGFYYLRMFGITAGYHRYFAHRAFRTGRAFQFLLALTGTLSVQKGVLWWAAHHRTHHKYSDQAGDIHSPKRGFFWAHVGWILCADYDETDWPRIHDFAVYPELRWLNRYFLVPPVAVAALLYAAGGTPTLVWGFFVSTAVLWHGTFTINSLAHLFGRQRFVTTDTSRNSFLLAVITMGEGWHNNHHYYQSTANQGFYWWELDLSYYILRALSLVGIVSDLRLPPTRVLDAGRTGPVRLARARAMLEWFPEAVQAALDGDRLRERLPRSWVRRLERANRKLEKLPGDVQARLTAGRKVLEQLPPRIRRILPTSEELLAVLSRTQPVAA
jgi:stearoyl-CoA desaturase (delta-9 desaturase)